jgi:hypothetical protein
VEHNQQNWEPEKTWVFAVGILEWEHGETWAPFPDAVEGRFDEKLVNFFYSREFQKNKSFTCKMERRL